MYLFMYLFIYSFIYLNSYWSTSISWDRAVVFIMAHMANRECLTLPEICCSILSFGSIAIVCGYFCRCVFCWFQQWFNSARNSGNPSAIRQCKLTEFVLFSRHGIVFFVNIRVKMARSHVTCDLPEMGLKHLEPHPTESGRVVLEGCRRDWLTLRFIVNLLDSDPSASLKHLIMWCSQNHNARYLGLIETSVLAIGNLKTPHGSRDIWWQVAAKKIM